MVEGRAEAGERLPLRRLEEHVEAALSLEEGFEVRGQERPRRVRLPAHRPVVPELDEEEVAMDQGVRAVRLLDLDEPAVPAEEQLVRVERDRPVDEVALVPLRVVVLGGDHHVFLLPLVDRLGRRQRRPPLPDLRDLRVARRGHRPGAEVRPDVEVVGVQPPHAVLGLGQEEAVLHERLRLEVELPHDVGVRASPRELDEAALVVRLEAVGSVPDPVLLLGGAQRVEVDHRLPGGMLLAVLLERRAPPEAAGVLCVPPEVVEEGAVLLDHGDAGVRVEDVEDALLEGGEAARLQDPGALGVAGPGPLEGLLARDVLEPEVAVLGGGRLGGVRGGGGKGRVHDQREGEGEAGHRRTSRFMWGDDLLLRAGPTGGPPGIIAGPGARGGAAIPRGGGGST